MIASFSSNSALGVIARRVALESQEFEVDDKDKIVNGPSSFKVGKNLFKLNSQHTGFGNDTILFAESTSSAICYIRNTNDGRRVGFCIADSYDPDSNFTAYVKPAARSYSVHDITKAIKDTVEEYGKQEIEKINKILEWVR
jgi:hypothetical protein